MYEVKHDLAYFLCALMLMTTGVVMVYSSSAAMAAREEKAQREKQVQAGAETQILADSAHSAAYLKKQALWALISIAAMLIAYQIDHEKYKRFSKPILFGTFVLLLMVFLPPPIGKVAKGSHRWIISA